MKKLCGLWLVATVLMAGCDSRGYIADWAGSGAVSLPLEVLGPNGTEAHVTLRLSAGEVDRARRLFFTVHGVRYQGQAAVRINDNPWVDLAGDAIAVAPQDMALGGIGGPSTLHMSLSAGATVLRNGVNKISFRFNTSDGVSNGFRVLDLNLIDEASNEILPVSRFVQADPSVKSGVATDAMVSAGRRVWRERSLLLPTPTGGRRLEARCGDCHTHDGRDLKYFGYSTAAIVARARFYGLAQEEGEQVAAYIEALRVPTLGRPWGPPYQPGRGTDEQSLESWAAGKGLAAVAASDAEVAKSLLAGDIAAIAATTGTLNLRQLPIAFPLPDWNQWLPRVHPRDAWGPAFTEAGIEQSLEVIRMRLDARGTSYALDDLDDDLYAWGVKGWNFLASREGAVNAGVKNADTETRRWMLVKVWELMQDFSLEALGPQIYGERAEKRTWWSRWGFVWGARPAEIDSNPIHQRAMWYHRLAWTHLSAVTNPGNRRHREHSPMDWAGAFEGARELSAAGAAQNSLMLTYLIKATQEADNGIGPEDPGAGWNLYNTEPEPLVDDAYEAHWDALAGVLPGQRLMVTEAFLRAWLQKAKSYTPSSYKRSASFAGKTWSADPVDHIPTANRFGGASDRLMYALPRLRALGVKAFLTDELCDFGAALWPRGEWAKFKSAP